MFNIILITPEISHPNEDVILHELVAAYNITIHVRKPSFNAKEYETYLSQNKNILPNMVLHEHHSLAKEFPVKGIHLKERDRKSATTFPNDVKVISTGFHTTEDVKKNSHEFEYIFYSPLFESISKENYGTNNTPEDLTKLVAELKAKTAVPVIGLGGINEENIALVKSSGFDGAALLGAIWESKDPMKAFERIYKK